MAPGIMITSPTLPCLALPSLPLSFKPLELKHLCSALFCQARNKNVSSAGAPEKSSVHFCFLISSMGEVFSAVCLCWGIVFDQAFCTLYLLPAAVCFPSAWLRGSQCVDVSFWVKRKLTVTLNVTLRPWPCSQAHFSCKCVVWEWFVLTVSGWFRPQLSAWLIFANISTPVMLPCHSPYLQQFKQVSD